MSSLHETRQTPGHREGKVCCCQGLHTHSMCSIDSAESTQGDSPTGMPPRRARPVTTLLAHPAWASIQDPLSKRPLTCCPSDAHLPAMAALASSFSPVNTGTSCQRVALICHCGPKPQSSQYSRVFGLIHSVALAVMTKEWHGP